MTDTTPAAKPMWKRHKGACNQRVFNDPIDWEGHLRNCPYDIRLKLDRLLDSLEKANIAERLEALEHADPVADPYAVVDSDLDDPDEVGYDERPFDSDVDEEPDGQPRRLTATSFYGETP